VKKHSSSGNRERIESDDLLRKLMELLLAYRGMIRLTVLKNIALVTHALITLYHGAREETVGFRKPPWPDVCPWEQGQKRGNRGFTGSWAISA
jgi:hypothetical protein